MTGILELEKIESEQKQKLPMPEKNTWILELPAEVCQREGFADGTMISLSVKNAEIQTVFIRPSVEIDDFINRVVEEEKEFFEEMKRIGD